MKNSVDLFSVPQWLSNEQRPQGFLESFLLWKVDIADLTNVATESVEYITPER